MLLAVNQAVYEYVHSARSDDDVWMTKVRGVHLHRIILERPSPKFCLARGAANTECGAPVERAPRATMIMTKRRTNEHHASTARLRRATRETSNEIYHRRLLRIQLYCVGGEIYCVVSQKYRSPGNVI